MQASVTTREAWMRLCTVVELVIPEYFWLSAYHDLSAIIFIGLGLDQDDEWPPIMGLVSAAKTVRGFWGGFWHRILYRSFNAHAASLSHRLGFEKGTLAARMMNNFLVFMFSAVMHSAVSARIGNQCAWGRNMAFWLLQPLAFVMEGVVQALWRRYWSTVALSKRQLQLLHGAEAVAGYCWVLCWFFWVEPKRIFPLAYCGKE
ncbi:hypothetical protein EJ04DRAFT_504692 [Polyplosphaeria fusca]|uniref:Wax synthase domain-containing protein n=1 Tax=Polyplosphaeria fusca TaxID=682080 RepID=A0A9P4QKM8_9PLEO|nr:hypothetical protein EJ04DRAFT_504692 [Polyplosphaeria fusca]